MNSRLHDVLNQLRMELRYELFILRKKPSKQPCVCPVCSDNGSTSCNSLAVMDHEVEPESDIANKLKEQYCFNGVETNTKESAKLLYKLGLAYRRKSPDKICLLQSAALLTSAILRKPDNVKKIEKDLNKLCLHILTLAKASNPNILLVDAVVKKAKQQIKMLRETTDKKLKYLGPTRDSLTGWRLKLLRKERSKYIRNLQKDITNQYKDVMKSIAGHVVNILGKPPCKFSLVGMGSIAKEEITPYSDFEHVIVLEEGIQNVKDYHKIMEYFRWFATLLLLIIILLGETVLSFLCIPCLNHPLDKEKNWFYDKYTPCGIRPDGFAPHASKHPLGRQTRTPDKPWINELIKPVSEMVKYLDSEEGMKEGYYLADMLTQTCLVYGDVITYEKLKMRVKQSHKWEVFGMSNVQQVTRDLDMCILVDANNHLKLDVKRFFYRGSSLFVQALGKLHGCHQSNVFEIIDELFQQQLIDSVVRDKLQFCFAVSCEARIRTYSKALSQQDLYYRTFSTEQMGLPSFITDMASEVGTRALVDCLSISRSLQVHVYKCFTTETATRYSAFENINSQLAIAVSLGLLQFADQLVKECNDPQDIKYSYNDTEFQLAKLFALKRCRQYQECLQQVNIHLRNLRKWKINENFLNRFIWQLYVTAAKCLTFIGKYKNALKFYRKANKVLYFFQESFGDQFKSQVDSGFGECFISLGRAKRALKYITLNYNASSSPETCIALANCLVSLSKFDEAKLVAEDLINQRKTLHVEENSDIFIDLAYSILEVCYQNLGDYKKFAQFCDKPFTKTGSLRSSSHFRDNVVFAPDIEEFYTAYCKFEKCMKQADTHGEDNNWDLAVYHCKQAEKMLPSLDAFLKLPAIAQIASTKQHPRVYFCNSIGIHLSKLHRFNEAVIYAKRGFRCSLDHDWPHGFHPCTKAASRLVVALFNCCHYGDCLRAAEHVMSMCQYIAWENFNTDPRFRVVVELFQRCEAKLGVSPTLPYMCSPSVYYLQ